MIRFIGTCVFVLFLATGQTARAQTVTANFENLTLDPQSYRDGLTLPGSFRSGGATFLAPLNTTYPDYPYGYGFAYSNISNTTTPGFTNPYAAYFTTPLLGPGSGGSSNYAIGSQSLDPADSIPTVALPAGYRATSVDLTNTTYAALSMINGDGFAKKFGGVTGTDPDWFKVTITGHNGTQTTGSIDFYLADFRFANSAQDYIVKDWTTIDLSALAVDTTSISFFLSSSDTGDFGMNTPAYFALDNLVMSPVPEPAAVGFLGAAGLLALRKLRRRAWRAIG